MMKNYAKVVHNACMSEQTKFKHPKNMYNIHFYKILMKLNYGT